MILYFGQKMITIKTAKPVDYGIDFKYICPTCEYSHWITMKESQTEGYKIVCDCDTIIEPLRIESIIINYSGSKKIDQKIIKECNDILFSYGYDKSEIDICINKYLKDNPSVSVKEIVKYCLDNIGEIDHV